MLPAAAIVYANQMMRFRRSDFERTCQLHSDDIVRDGIARVDIRKEAVKWIIVYLH